jgi:hypothetical protein
MQNIFFLFFAVLRFELGLLLARQALYRLGCKPPALKTSKVDFCCAGKEPRTSEHGLPLNYITSGGGLFWWGQSQQGYFS